ncbi:MAG: DUF1015 domain-containing protein [Chloroflexi bacterium]|nr:DUF1015 domain-containing protein [Chloroflexota bacterium]
MVEIEPFRGLLFDPALSGDLGQVLCPPYDVIAPAEQEVLLQASPFNIVRVELPRSDARGDRYAAAAAAFADWRSKGVLRLESVPSFYLHEIEFPHGDRRLTRRALTVALRLASWEAGEVLPHERTMSGPKEDRLNLMRAVKANISPVMAFYRGGASALDRAWALATEGSRPLAEIPMLDGTVQRLWAIADPATVAAIQADFANRPLYIADGHHRYETALRYRDEAANGGALRMEHPANYVMAQIWAEDDPGLLCLPIHRLLRGVRLDQIEIEELLSDVWHGEYFPIWESFPREQQDALLQQLDTAGQNAHAVGLFGPDPSIFTILTLRDRGVLDRRRPERSEAWRQLDVSLVDEALIGDLLERAGADRHASLSFDRDPYAAIRSVLTGEQEIAILLNPTKVQQILGVADAHDRMPEKSTYFHPKPPTGLVLRLLDA